MSNPIFDSNENCECWLSNQSVPGRMKQFLLSPASPSDFIGLKGRPRSFFKKHILGSVEFIQFTERTYCGYTVKASPHTYANVGSKKLVFFRSREWSTSRELCCKLKNPQMVMDDVRSQTIHSIKIENCRGLSRPPAADNCSAMDSRSEAFFDRPQPTNAAGTRAIIAAIGGSAHALGTVRSTAVVNLTPHRLVKLAVILLGVSFSQVHCQTQAPRSNLSWAPLGNELVDSHLFHPITAVPVVVTGPKQSGHDPMWVHRLIFASLNGLLFLLGLANVLVLFIVSRYRRMRTVTNILIFNLCLADLIYISFLPVVIMFQLLRDWMFGVIACKLFYITESTAKYASVYFVGVLSLDRYFALCHPQVCKRYRKPSLALLVSAVGWFVTAVLMMPIYLYSTVIGQEGERFCTVAWPNDQENMTADLDSTVYPEATYYFWNDTLSERANLSDHHPAADCHDPANYTCPTPPYPASHAPPSAQFYFITLTFVFCFGIPALVILFFYFQVLEQLFQASDRAERLKKRREKTYRKVTRMVLAVISFYLLCWLPYWIQFLVVTFAAFSLNNALKIFFNSIHLLPYLNCAMNPILYSLMTDNFRRILAELFPISGLAQCCRRRGRRKSRKSTQGGQAVALLDKSNHPDLNGPTGDDHAPLHRNSESGFTSLSTCISPSIRMVSDFSINLLMVQGMSNENTRSNSAGSINSML